MLLLVTAALAAKSVLVAAAVLEMDRWAALVALSALPLIALLVSPALLLHGRSRTAYLVSADVLVTLLLVADLLNARASGRLLSLHMVAAAGSFEGLGSSVLAMVRWYDVVLFADLLALGALAASARWRRSHPRKQHRRVRPRTAALVAGGAALAFAVQVLAQSSDPGLRVVALSPLGAHAHEAYDELVDINRALTPAERERVGDWLAGNAAYQREVAPEHADLVGLLEGRDVYLVQFESLEEVVLEAEPFGQEVTPTLNGWMEESLVFDHVVEQVRDGTSSDAELLMLAGVYPLRSGAAFMRFPDNAGYTSLPRLLQAEGYRPVALHGDVRTFWNRDRVFPRLGYERYVAERDFAHGTELGMGLADEDLFDQALREIDRLPAPRFLHLITTTSHTPWHLPEPLQGLELPGDDATSRYLQTVHYTDAQLGQFARELEERGLLERSAIVVVGDHQGPSRYVAEDELWLDDNEDRVPFLVHVPGMDGRRISTSGGQVDVLPTLAQLLGIPAERYAGAVMGRTLLGPHSGSAVSSDGEVLPGADGAELLREAYAVSDLAVTGDWFARPR
ncbi:LTA synthase family protein [Ornithinimicrobium pekingense]|uniref:Sulfatase N-terminal domain-containing protein n=1 Tax=Ornithinimicrobium pekingense TaxID=384677 RepID=A0ABQ2FAN0_9MICO|nr:LTA synthase family protein [Ornithinimicrobium pekingense]GGK68973.1 hypothetical protein GCM10011509_16730 [Ornithinimicrobium pekingense]